MSDIVNCYTIASGSPERCIFGNWAVPPDPNLNLNFEGMPRGVAIHLLQNSSYYLVAVTVALPGHQNSLNKHAGTFGSWTAIV